MLALQQKRLEGYIMFDEEYDVLMSCCNLLTQHNKNRLFIAEQHLKELKRVSKNHFKQNGQNQQNQTECPNCQSKIQVNVQTDESSV